MNWKKVGLGVVFGAAVTLGASTAFVSLGASASMAAVLSGTAALVAGLYAIGSDEGNFGAGAAALGIAAVSIGMSSMAIDPSERKFDPYRVSKSIESASLPIPDKKAVSLNIS